MKFTLQERAILSQAIADLHEAMSADYDNPDLEALESAQDKLTEIYRGESEPVYVELTSAQLRCLYLGPWFTGDVCPTDEPVRVFAEGKDSVTSVYAEFALDGEWLDTDGTGVVIDRGGCMYASGPFRENRDEDTCHVRVVSSDDSVALIEIREKRHAVKRA